MSTTCPCHTTNHESAMVTLRRDDAGKPTVWCDACIAPLVAALNDAGLTTDASCCGHGELHGWIMLRDGRELVIRRTPDERPQECPTCARPWDPQEAAPIFRQVGGAYVAVFLGGRFERLVNLPNVSEAQAYARGMRDAGVSAYAVKGINDPELLAEQTPAEVARMWSALAVAIEESKRGLRTEPCGGAPPTTGRDR